MSAQTSHGLQNGASNTVPRARLADLKARDAKIFKKKKKPSKQRIDGKRTVTRWQLDSIFNVIDDINGKEVQDIEKLELPKKKTGRKDIGSVGQRGLCMTGS